MCRSYKKTKTKFIRKFLQNCNFIKKGLQHRCLPVNNVKFLRTISFVEHLRKAVFESKILLITITKKIKNIYNQTDHPKNKIKKLSPDDDWESKNKIHLAFTAKKHIKTKKVFCIMKKGIFLSLSIFSLFCQLLLY